MPFPVSHMFTCRQCGVHLHPEQVPLVLGPPNRHDQLLPLLRQHAFDAAEGFEAAKAET